MCGVDGVGGVGVIIESNLNRVRFSCCWVGVGLGCDKNKIIGPYWLSTEVLQSVIAKGLEKC